MRPGQVLTHAGNPHLDMRRICNLKIDGGLNDNEGLSWSTTGDGLTIGEDGAHFWGGTGYAHTSDTRLAALRASDYTIRTKFHSPMGSNQLIYGLWNGVQSAGRLGMYLEPNTRKLLVFEHGPNGTPDRTLNTHYVVPNQPITVDAERSGTDIRVFVDGEQKGAIFAGIPPFTNYPTVLRVGRLTTGTTYDLPMLGVISRLQIWAKALHTPRRAVSTALNMMMQSGSVSDGGDYPETAYTIAGGTVEDESPFPEGKSLLCNAPNEYVRYTGHPAIACRTYNFHFIQRVKIASLTSQAFFVDCRNLSTGQSGWCLFAEGGVFRFAIGVTTYYTTVSPVAGGDYYFEYSRVYGIGYLFINGNLELTFPDATDYTNDSMVIGACGYMYAYLGISPAMGYISEAVLVNGEGGHTENYTVPTEPWHN